jgi:hypothetical protein
MPTFNWDGDGVPTINSGFRYYWAVTIPVTILVLLIWTLARLLPGKSWVERLITGNRRTFLSENVGGEMGLK